MIKWTKVLAMLLAMMMLFSVVACASTGDGEETTAPKTEETTANNSGDSGNAEGTTGSGNTETEMAQLSVPEDVKLNEEVSILYWSDVEMAEFEVEDITGDTVGDEIYWRNKYTEDYLAITLKWYGTPGNWGNRNAYANFVQASYEANDRTYDILAAYARTLGICSAKGYLADLNAVEDSYIDLSKPWWPQSLVDTVTIGDSMYFISGDISTNTLYFMYGIFCNVNMLNNLNLDDPHQLVMNDEWTLEKFMSMCEGVYADTDADGAASAGDTFGFVTHKLHLDQFYVGAGLKLIEKDEVDTLVMSPDYNSQKLYDLVDTIQKFIHSQDVFKNTSNSSAEFKEDRALFTHNRLYFADNHLKEVTFTYTILPCPKYDAEQETYLTVVGNPFSLWGIMSDVPAADQTKYTAVLEVLGYYGYKHTSPAIFEVNYKSKYSESDEASLMFDYIRSGVYHDLGRIFPTDLLSANMIELVTAVIWNNESWASMYSTYARGIKKKLATLVETFEDYQA